MQPEKTATVQKQSELIKIIVFKRSFDFSKQISLKYNFKKGKFVQIFLKLPEQVLKFQKKLQIV